MKQTCKKVTAMLVAVVMVLSMGVVAFAAPVEHDGGHTVGSGPAFGLQPDDCTDGYTLTVHHLIQVPGAAAGSVTGTPAAVGQGYVVGARWQVQRIVIPANELWDGTVIGLDDDWKTTIYGPPNTVMPGNHSTPQGIDPTPFVTGPDGQFVFSTATRGFFLVTNICNENAFIDGDTDYPVPVTSQPFLVNLPLMVADSGNPQGPQAACADCAPDPFDPDCDDCRAVGGGNYTWLCNVHVFVKATGQPHFDKKVVCNDCRQATCEDPNACDTILFDAEGNKLLTWEFEVGILHDLNMIRPIGYNPQDPDNATNFPRNGTTWTVPGSSPVETIDTFGDTVPVIRITDNLDSRLQFVHGTGGERSVTLTFDTVTAPGYRVVPAAYWSYVYDDGTLVIRIYHRGALYISHHGDDENGNIRASFQTIVPYRDLLIGYCGEADCDECVCECVDDPDTCSNCPTGQCEGILNSCGIWGTCNAGLGILINPGYLEFGQNPGVELEIGDDDPDRPGDTPFTLLYGIIVRKVNQDGETLEGAIFHLYHEGVRIRVGADTVTCGDCDDDCEEMVYIIIPCRTAGCDVSVNDQGVVTGNCVCNDPVRSPVQVPCGSTAFLGLPPGVYYVYEYQSPDGYRRVTYPIQVVIVCQLEYPHADRIFRIEFNFVNQRGFDLPMTGGAGTIMFTIGGLALIGGAIMLIIFAPKKKAKEQNAA